MLRALVAGLLLITSAAFGDEGRGTVVILRPVRGGPALEEAATRLHAELRASGFVVQVQERQRPRGVLAYEAGAVMALKPQPLAALSIFETDGELEAALWRVDTATGRPEAFRVSVQGGGGAPDDRATAPAVLAIRAVELLHASLTGVVIDAPKLFPPPPGSPPPPEAVAVGAAPPPPPRESFEGLSVDLGVSLLASFQGIGPAAQPMLRLGYGWRGGMDARVVVMGGGTAGVVRAPEGNVDVDAKLVAAELGHRFGTGPWIPRFFASLGAGHVRVAGRAQAPYTARREAFWALAGAAGGTLGLRLTPRVTGYLDARALFMAPPLQVKISDRPVGSSGRPSLLAGVGLSAGL